MSREVMQQALDTFVLINELSKGDNAVCLPGEIDDAMDALRNALQIPPPPPEAQTEAEKTASHYGWWAAMEAVRGQRTEPVEFVCSTGLCRYRKPLTDEEIALIVGECAASAHRHDDFSFARAIEQAHGIKQESQP